MWGGWEAGLTMMRWEDGMSLQLPDAELWLRRVGDAARLVLRGGGTTLGRSLLYRLQPRGTGWQKNSSRLTCTANYDLVGRLGRNTERVM
jgi:hypothetical protein